MGRPVSRRKHDACREPRWTPPLARSPWGGLDERRRPAARAVGDRPFARGRRVAGHASGMRALERARLGLCGADLVRDPLPCRNGPQPAPRARVDSCSCSIRRTCRGDKHATCRSSPRRRRARFRRVVEQARALSLPLRLRRASGRSGLRRRSPRSARLRVRQSARRARPSLRCGKRGRAPRPRCHAGVGSIIELGDVQVAATSAGAQKVQTEQDLASARARLLRAIGREG